MMFNRIYGKYTMTLGVIFTFSNIVAGSVYFYFGSGGYDTAFRLKN